MRRLISVLVLVSLLATSPFFSTTKANAVSASSWRAGRIIEDSYFTDTNSMSVQDIQNFLNSKNASCDSLGTKASEFGGGTRAQYGAAHGNPAPFTCLKDYYEVPKTEPGSSLPANNYGSTTIPDGAISAAQIIKNSADRHGISPRVLLVKLATESAGPLTSDEWPFLRQYTYAMGAHCPDSGPNNSPNCDPNYGGFSYQLDESAALLETYLKNMTQPWWTLKKPFQNNLIAWNPDASCGSQNVFIENKSTAALYTYTPYQPNQAALYGSGDACSAYGNLNFWRVYSDWFGNSVYSYSKSSASSNYANTPCTVLPYSTAYVGRLYQPDTQDYFWTTDYQEACRAVSIGYIWDGVVFANSAADSDALPIYRISGNDRHVFTSSVAVRDDYVSRGFKDEGIGFYLNSTPSNNTIPVIGLQKDFTFYITSSGKEAELSQNQGFYSFGTIFYTRNLNEANPVPVYRLSRNNSRLYTTDPSEKYNAIAHYGFADEGVITQNDSYPNPANAPLYRLRSPWGEYFYTQNRIERDAAVILYGYYSEGIGFYTLLYSNSPAYRAFDPRIARRIWTNSEFEYRLALSRYGYVGESVGWYGY